MHIAIFLISFLFSWELLIAVMIISVWYFWSSTFYLKISQQLPIVNFYNLSEKEVIKLLVYVQTKKQKG